MRKLTFFFISFFGLYAGYYYQKKYEPNIAQIYVVGCKHFPAEYIHKQAQYFLTNTINLQHLQHHIMQIDYVKNVNLTLVPPNQLFIYIQEHNPIAQTTKQEIISDEETIIKSKPIFTPQLLQVTGTGFMPHLHSLQTALTQHPYKPTLCIFVRPGRWNLLLAQKLIKLPENEISEGLTNLTKLIQKKPGLYKKASAIDLRKLGYAIITTKHPTADEWITEISTI